MRQFGIIIFLAWSFVLSGQKYSLDIQTIEMDNTTVDAVVATIDPSQSWIRDAWDDWMKEQHDINFDKRQFLFFSKKTMSAEDVKFSAISPKNVNLYTTTKEVRNESSQLIVYGQYVGGRYFQNGGSKETLDDLRTVVSMFMKETLPSFYVDQIEETNESIEDLKDENEELKEKIEDHQEEIASAKKDIEKNKKKIRQLNNAQLEEKKAKKQINKKLYNK